MTAWAAVHSQIISICIHTEGRKEVIMWCRRISTISTEDLCNFTDITAGMKVENTDQN